MKKEQLFSQYNPWWEAGYQYDQIIPRDRVLNALYSWIDTPDVIMMTGIRRVGKTTIMKCLIRYLIEKRQINPYHCFYISMDDYLLSTTSLAEVIDDYRKLMKLPVSQKIYLFFDEITYVPDFQIQLKNLYDKGNVKCFVSSSSSSILNDNSAYLTGRKRVIEIDPLDFNEYLIFKNIRVSKADQGLLESYFLEYMQVGGMPEYVLRGEREYLVNLIDDIIMKDIVSHHGIRQPNLIRDFFILLMERSGKQVSISKMAHILSVSPDTIKRYLALFEKTYMIHLVSRYGKTNETLLSAKKIYSTDIGMRNIIVGFRDKGAIFENIVFMKIKKHRPQYVYYEGQEIDFFVKETLLEVKYHKKLEGKQYDAFKKFNAKRKQIINGYADLGKLEAV